MSVMPAPTDKNYNPVYHWDYKNVSFHTGMRELAEMLRKHDWFYSFSDDHRVWCAGEKAMDEIKEKAGELGPPGQRLLMAYADTQFHPGNGFQWDEESCRYYAINERDKHKFNTAR